MMMDSPEHDRRLTLRLMAYWERLRASRTMPSQKEIEPENLSDVWDYCFLLPAENLSNATIPYTYLGDNLSNWLGDTQSPMNIKRLRAGYPRVVETMRPVLEEGEFEGPGGQLVKYRQCLLPLGENGQVQAILGGIRFKIFG